MSTNRKMEIVISPIDTQSPSLKTQQQVNFINILEERNISTSVPSSIDYDGMPQNTIALWNFKPYSNIEVDVDSSEGVQAIKSSDVLTVDVFKQEMEEDEFGNLVTVTALEPVALNVSNFHLKDYNISNNRTYKYVIYPSDKSASVTLTKVEQIIETAWSSWSITELHPTDSTMKNFTASSSDVWLFKYNVETGEQSQNISRNQQQTLGQYSRFTQGQQNYISGTVSCLLGSEMTPMSYLLKNGQMTTEGGYQEILLYSNKTSSNAKVSMLKAWRDLVYSSNPKLLKDRKGQAFLVTLTDSKNKPMDNVRYQPDTISFSWHQIGTLDGVQITNTDLVE